MLITVTEAATLLGLTPRAVRGRGRVGAWLEAPDSPELRVHLRRSLAGSMGVLLG